MDSIQTITVTRSDFHFEPGPDTFVFTPPPGTTKVASLPTGFTGPPPAGATATDKSAAHLDHPLPDITLHAPDGTEVNLSSYRGHPLLIDVWATWCAPCLSEMPALNHIRVSTSGTDLRMIGIDEDLHSVDAQALLKERGYIWQDFPYTHEAVKALGVSGIPLIVLTNAEGTIVYYHSGADDAKGLASAIAKLGPAYEGVKVD
jgi:thiol-disulfide isomerase/thioredoxin